MAQPENWIRYTKNMECGEEREFKQSCIDDEIIIEALERMLQDHPTEKGGEQERANELKKQSSFLKMKL